MCKPLKDNEHIAKMKHSREERECMMSDFFTKHDALINALDNFNGKNNADIPKYKLREFPVMEWVDLEQKNGSEVKIRRRASHFENILVFDTYMSKGGQFGMHLHSDCIESLEVVSGRLVDLTTNKNYVAGDVATFDKKQPHTPVSLEDTTLVVYFK